MKVLIIAIAICLGSCAKEVPTNSTPVADYFISNQGTFIDDNCSGIYNANCERLYWEAFTGQLSETYNELKPTGKKFCSFAPSDCIDERETERIFQRGFTFD